MHSPSQSVLLALLALAIGSCLPACSEKDQSAADMKDSTVESSAATAATTTPATSNSGSLKSGELGAIERLHVHDGILLASQPSPEDLEQAKQAGVQCVVNMRHEREIEGFDERQIVTDLGMEYENPAWGGPAELTDESIGYQRELLRTAKRPVLVHCASANRTGAIWFAYRAIDDKLPVEEALAEAKMVGLRSPEFERIIRDYIKRKTR